jgi:hypothetical protein
MKVSVSLTPYNGIRVYENTDKEVYLFDAKKIFLIDVTITNGVAYGELVNYETFISKTKNPWINNLKSFQDYDTLEPILVSKYRGIPFWGTDSKVKLKYDSVMLYFSNITNDIHLNCLLSEYDKLKKYINIMTWRETGINNNIAIDSKKLQECNFFVVNQCFDGCVDISTFVNVSYFKIENGCVVDIDDGFIFDNVSSMDELAYLFGNNTFYNYEFVWVTD